MIKKTLLITALLVVTSIAQAIPLLTENFDNVAALSASGWVMTNNSTPAGATGWFQGNAGVFDSQAGAADSYIGANFENAAFGGNISNWLLTPTFTVANGQTLTFFTRTDPSEFFADQLEIRLSQNGLSTDVGTTDSSLGDFTTLLASINATLDPLGYPAGWAQYSVTLSGVTDGLLGRLAFRYSVPDTSINGNYIGIDSVTLNDVPEPSSLALFAAALLPLGMSVARRRGTRSVHPRR